MQFDNQKTRNVADVAARIMAGESVQKKPQQLDEKLHPNQQVLDVHEPEKDELTAKDFEMLRKKKKMKKEEVELTESHFKVGDEVVCKKSGMEGEVVKVDEPQVGKYYTVKQENGKMVKYAPDELKKEEEDEDEDEDEDKKEMKEAAGASKDQETKFHKKLDTLVHKTFGKRKEEMKEEAELDEAKKGMWPGTPEYKAKFGTDKEKHEAKYGKSDVKKLAPYGYRDKSEYEKAKEMKEEKSFSAMLESYREGGLKYIASLVKEEPDNEQYTKEVEKAKAKDRGENRNDKGVAKPFQSASVREEPVNPVREEVEELDELSKGTLADYAKKATHSARIKQKIAKDFEAGAQRARKPDMKAAGEELSKKYQRKAQKREEGVGKAIDRLAKEEVEQVDEVLDSAGKFMSYATKAAASGLKSAVMGTGKYRKRQAGIQKAVEKAKAKVNEEVEELDEREMTDAEMKKREEIVKSMKKGLSGFKQRYGDRAKEVMYATAAKIAKEKA